jgi:UDP-glucose:glycoprotein glucosyltransferase
VVDDSEDVDGMQDAGVAILRAYNYVVQEVDDYHAFQTLTHVCFCSKWHMIMLI